MKSVQFCYWLQGFFEIAGADAPDQPITLTPQQVKMVQAHLNMVFVHEIDPSMGDAKHQAQLNAVHDEGKPPAKPTAHPSPAPPAPWSRPPSSGGGLYRC